MAYVENDRGRTLISGSAIADDLRNWGENVTIRAGGGDDTVRNYGGRGMLYGESGTDNIRNENADNVTVDGGSGDDYILSTIGNNVFLNGGSDYDEVRSYNGNNVTLFGGDDNDRLYNLYGAYASLNGGDGNDWVDNYNSEFGTLTGGAGDDYIFNNECNDPTLIDPEGNNTIVGTGRRMYAQGGDGNDVISLVGDQSTINAGGGNNTVYNSGTRGYITVGSGNNYVETSGERVTVNAGAGNDTLRDNSSSNVTLDAGAGDNHITVYSATYNEMENVSVNAGDGNDYIRIYADGYYDGNVIKDVTINAGEGNNTIVADWYYYAYKTIDNLVINVGDGDDYASLTYNNFALDVGGGNNEVYSSGSNLTLNAGSGNDYFETSGDHIYISLGGGIDTVSNTNYNSIYIYGADSDDQLLMSSNNASDILLGAGNDTATLTGTVYYHYTAGDGNDVLFNVDSSKLIRLDDATVSGYSVSGSDFILNVGSGSLTLKDATNKDISIRGADGGALVYRSVYNVSNSIGHGTVFGGTGNDSITNSGSNLLISANDGNDNINNSAAYVTANGGSGHDYVYSTGDDVIINAGNGNDTVDNRGARVTVGSPDGSNRFINYGSYVSLNGGSEDDYIENHGMDATIRSGTGADYIWSNNSNYGGTLIIDSGDDDDTISNHGANASIVAGEGDDSIYDAGGLNVTINAGLGDDIINLGSSNNVIEYSVGDGDDTIFGYSTDDTIKITTGRIRSSAVDGNDIILEFADGSLTLKDVVNSQMITVSDANDSVTSRFYANEKAVLPKGLKLNKKETVLTVKAPFTGTVIAADYSSSIQTINASANKNAVYMIGNRLDNVLKASKGGSTLEGGAGDDKLNGGKGNDLFIYDGQGDDVISKYTAGDDKVKLTAAITDVSIKGSNVIFSVGDGTLTVKSVAKKELTIIDEDGVESTYVFTKTNNDLDSARISTSAQLPSYWFDDDAQSDPLNAIMSEEPAVDLEGSASKIAPCMIDQPSTTAPAYQPPQHCLPSLRPRDRDR